VSGPLVIVGNGMAAARLVDELTRCALGRHAIAVIGDEPRLAYNRGLLSSVLAGETALEAIELKPMSRWLLPVLALLRHADGHSKCLFIGVDRKSSADLQNVAFDPELNSPPSLLFFWRHPTMQ
jgi:hypothetical protein